MCVKRIIAPKEYEIDFEQTKRNMLINKVINVEKKRTHGMNKRLIVIRLRMIMVIVLGGDAIKCDKKTFICYSNI